MTEHNLPDIDTSRPHPARRYDYWLGGKDNFAVDRESGDKVAEIFPHIRTAAVENRRFLQRAVRLLVSEAGIRQFLDIGTGLPTAENTHQVAQRLAPESRVVYVDNDPMVLVHARALLTSDPRGKTAYVDADLANPGTVFGDQAVAETLDLTRPVGLLLVAVLHFLPDEQAYPAVATFVDALPSGSYVVLSHATSDPGFMTDEQRERTRQFEARDESSAKFHTRTLAEIQRFFDGLDVVDPGFVGTAEWRPDPGDPPVARWATAAWSAVARKP